jgi:hypothetical protein
MADLLADLLELLSVESKAVLLVVWKADSMAEKKVELMADLKAGQMGYL